MIYPATAEAVRALSSELNIGPVLAQILVNRGLHEVEAAEAFLLGGHESLLEPERLEGIAEAADIVAESVRRGERILVHGDYDADGVSGCALLVAFLRDVGADAMPYIPHRIDEGYGLSGEGARHAAAEGFRLMVSVDCGSSSPDVVELARSLGLKVVVTDHHMVSTPPPADAFVNPRAPGTAYPFPHLSGAGVAFKLICAVSRRLGCGEPEAYLDLAAIGTVGDVVPLVGENRILVREGLAIMERMERPGIAALARVAGLGSEGNGEQPTVARSLSARDVAFEIAPRINACGRLEHALQACLLLLETDESRADELAREVDALNRQRREMEASVREAAEAKVRARDLGALHAIVEADEGWHQGIVGITANRLLDKYGVPAFVISIGEDGTAKGSARAPAHLDLYECLKQCADLFTHYGGHPRAGGFSLPAERIDALRERLQEVVPRVAGPPEPALRVDLELPLAQADMTLVEELEALAPLGQANPPPLFLARAVRIRYAEKIKDRHWRFLAAQPDASARCIAFNLVERRPDLHDGTIVDMIYEVELEQFRGEPRLTFKVRELIGGEPAAAGKDRPAISETAEPTSRRAAAPLPACPPSTGWEIVDARGELNRGRYLADVVAGGNLTHVLCRRDQVGFVRRVIAAGEGEPPASLRVHGYGAPLSDGVEAGAEWVLFTPPPGLAALTPLQGACGGRCHVLFGGEDLARESALVDAVSMSRERLERVYRLFKSRASREGVFDEAWFPRMLEEARLYDLRVESLKVALRVFVEIGVIAASPRFKGRYRLTGERAPLETSSTYARYAAIGTEFAAVRDLFSETRVSLEAPLLAVITSGRR
jgi:single-stranded-DNA-specific exonuclease RecJ